ncbi:MAG: homoserine kinase [Nitriliruptor sp.]
MSHTASAPVHHTVTVPATTANLGAGFDAFGLALRGTGDLAAVLAVRSLPRSAQDERVRCSGEGAGEVASDDDNLVWRSLVRFCEHHDVPVPDVALHAHSTIPLERGLGSSSSAIVAGLVLGRALTGVSVGDRDLVGLADAIEGHPDNVAPALLGGLVACATDDDGRLVIRRINPAPALRPVVLVPTTRQATTSARAVLPESLVRADVAVQAARAGHVLGALVGAWPASVGLSGDLLHEPARFAAMPATGAIVTALRAAGVHAWLSGAGPSVAAVLTGPGDGPVARVAEVAAEGGFVVHPAEFQLTGALACPDGGCALAGSVPGGADCVRCPRRAV